MVQRANLQSLVARRSAKPCYSVLLFRLSDPAAGRAFLNHLLPRITNGEMAELVGTPVLNLFLSWRGMSVLLADHPQFDLAVGRRQFEPFFVDPLQAPDSLAIAEQLGFTGPSDPSQWWANFNTGHIDLAVYVGCDSEEQRRSVNAELRSAAVGLSELTLPSFPDQAMAGYLPPGGRLHFGYRDGITVPEVDWDDTGGPGTVNLREFVLGYPNSDYPTAPYPPGPWQDFARDGSFVCMTWIHQDVAGFEAFLSAHAKTLAPSLPGVDAKEWLAAQLMGRWRDGTPLALHPLAPPDSPDLVNSFGYADDPQGVKCPLHAHIRVAYSRDQPLSFPNARRFPNGSPRLIRRGFSYGERLDSDEDDGEDRGLFGLFLCARINEQFYTVLRWMQHTDFSDAFRGTQPGRAGQDSLVGSRRPGGDNSNPDTTTTVTANGLPTSISLRSFIHYKGVAALFLPSMTALGELAAT